MANTIDLSKITAAKAKIRSRKVSTTAGVQVCVVLWYKCGDKGAWKITEGFSDKVDEWDLRDKRKFRMLFEQAYRMAKAHVPNRCYKVSKYKFKTYYIYRYEVVGADLDTYIESDISYQRAKDDFNRRHVGKAFVSKTTYNALRNIYHDRQLPPSQQKIEQNIKKRYRLALKRWKGE
jgi:hypothetical protein